MSAALFLMQPGPKMVLEFDELGYDFSRCYLSTNGEGGDCNTKTNPKPIRWGYQSNADRQALYNVYKRLIVLSNYAPYLPAFTAPKDSIQRR